MRKMLLAGFLLALSVTSAGAVETGPPGRFASGGKTSTGGGILGAVQQITIEDLQNALDDANAQVPPDTRHAQCWSVLIPFVQGWQAASLLPTKPGLALLVQKTFDAKQLVGKPLIPDNVVEGCALTMADAQLTLAQLTAALGITAIAIPKLPIIP